MDIKIFAGWVGLVEPAVIHSDSWDNEVHQIYQILHHHNVPAEWWEPVRVMAQGNCYYSADTWYERYVLGA